MLFRNDPDVVAILLKLKKRHEIGSHHIDANGAADERRQLARTQSDILLDLHPAEPVVATLSLHRYYIVCAALVQTHVDFVRLYLPYAGNRCAQMILQGITGDTKKQVNQTVVSNAGQDGLFIAERVLGDDSRCGVGYLGNCGIRIWREGRVADQCDDICFVPQTG